MKKTAVDWYANQAMKLETKRQSGKISTEQMVNELIKVLNQAKEMEKEQIKNTFNNGYLNHSRNSEQYYNETFKSDQ